MPIVNPSPIGVKPQYELINGDPAVGNQLFFYVAGSTGTKLSTYANSSGASANPNPIVLNALGQPTNEIWFASTLAYKVVYAPSTDTDPPAAPIWSIDNLIGINDTVGVVDEWIPSGITPTFINATSFSMPGDQTTQFQVGRRVKSANSAGTVYSTISTSVFSSGITTVTLVNDAGALDSGLSQVWYGIISAQHTSLPAQSVGAFLPLTGGVLTGPLTGTTALFSSTMTANDVNTNSVTTGTILATGAMTGNSVLLSSTMTANDVNTNSVTTGTILATGTVTIPTVATSTDSGIAASTAFVHDLVDGLGGTAPHTHPESDITGLVADLAAKAPLNSPNFTGTPQVPTLPFGVGHANLQIVNSEWFQGELTSRLAGYTPTNGAGAGGLWTISITGNAATASNGGVTSVNGMTGAVTVPVGAVTSINGLTGAITIVGRTAAVDGGVNGIEIGVIDSSTIRVAQTDPGGDGESLHYDSLIEMGDGSTKWLRDIRIGDRVRGRNGPAEVLGIWRTQLAQRDLYEIGKVVCTRGHLFPIEGGKWATPSREGYAKDAFGRKRLVKGKTGMIRLHRTTNPPDTVEELSADTRIMRSDGTFHPAGPIKHYEENEVNAFLEVMSLYVDGSNIIFADGFAVGTVE